MRVGKKSLNGKKIKDVLKIERLCNYDMNECIIAYLGTSSRNVRINFKLSRYKVGNNSHHFEKHDTTHYLAIFNFRLMRRKSCRFSCQWISRSDMKTSLLPLHQSSLMVSPWSS